VADSDTITGQVEPRFEVVRDAFAANFDQGCELGAAFCVHLEGRKVVDLYGGSFDVQGQGRTDPRPGCTQASSAPPTMARPSLS
jgi:hypothetical protein